ncbi:MAG: GMC family oxidoreductase [Actinobacteria bacterium]|nr:GMC family oxidoreductase [Actinomycetota bacterium]
MTGAAVGRDADVLVIGAGASGGVVAKRLAEAGVSVICLEQGDWVDPAEFPGEAREFDALISARWHPDPNRRGGRSDYPIDVADSEVPPTMFNAVGGSLLLYNGSWPRMLPSDFRVRTLDGVADDWPITYEDLAPYYAQVERDFHVSGLAGDPAYPPHQEYPLPPLPLGRFGEVAAKGMNARGWHWWPHPTAISSQANGHLAACVRLGTCMAGCPRGAKATTDLTHWPEAIAAGAELITGARVREVLIDRRGRAAGAVYLDRAGVEQRKRAGAVVLAANGVGTARLLLLSASVAHPDGLANSSGLVGKRLMMHPPTSVVGVYEEELMSWIGPAGPPVISLEFAESDEDRGFPRGAKWDAFPVAGLHSHIERLADLPFDERYGAAYHRNLRRLVGHAFDWDILVEDLPLETNRVELSDSMVDGDGIASPRVSYKLSADTRANLAFQVARATEAHEAAGAIETFVSDWYPSQGWHLLGTARCGEDPATSVVDAHGEAHDVPNLFVVDGSVFVTSSAVNPTASICAFALRAADHLILRSRQ